jgi:phosphate transport system substrate-binding protein
MSAHITQPGSRARRPAHPGTWAVAVAIALLTAACTSTSSATGPDTAASVVAAASAGGHAPTMTGAGSTFDAPFFSVAFARYQQQHPGVSIGYSAVGSSAGIAAFRAGRVDFGASDVPMTAAEQAAAKGGPITQVPVALGGEGVVYNLSLPAGARLHLTGPVLAAIFLGQVTRWNDPAITALNPGVPLPPARINVVHRSDGSGTTYIFSNYLSSVDPEWAAKVGTGKTLHWPIGEGAEGNGGVAATVNRTAFSIGYVEQAYSQGLLLPFAAIRNQAGRYVIPSTQTVAADAAQKPGITPVDFSRDTGQLRHGRRLVRGDVPAHCRPRPPTVRPGLADQPGRPGRGDPGSADRHRVRAGRTSAPCSPGRPDMRHAARAAAPGLGL